MKTNSQTSVLELRISTRLQPGVGGRRAKSAVSTASCLGWEAAKAATLAFDWRITGLKPGAYVSVGLETRALASTEEQITSWVERATCPFLAGYQPANQRLNHTDRLMPFLLRGNAAASCRRPRPSWPVHPIGQPASALIAGLLSSSAPLG